MVIYKSNQLSVKDVDDTKGIIKAYYSAYGNEDSDGDVIMMGAATKSVNERGVSGTNRIKHLKNHDRTLQPGVIQELGEDQNGGWFVSKLMQHNGEFTALAKDTLIEYQMGGITEHSHGLEITKSHKGANNSNIVTEIKLWEASTLNAWGANPLTPTTSVKSEKDYLELLVKLETLIKNGKFSDEYLKNLEKNIAALNMTLTEIEPRKHSKDNEPFKFSIEKFDTYLNS